MSAFLAKKLSLILQPALSIREFRESIKSILGPLVDEYWKIKNPKASVVIIFGGINNKERKKLNRKEIHDKVIEYGKLSNRAINLKPALFNLMVKPTYPEPPDSHIFSVQIAAPSQFIIEDAEWGEYLAYGPNGITKNFLSPITFGMVEFSAGNDTGHDNVSITAILNEVIEKTKEETIGDAFVHMIVTEKLIGALGGNVYAFNPATSGLKSFPEILVENRRLIVKYEDGRKLELTSIKDYSGFGNLEI